LDWVGQWYALQEEVGEFARIRFGRVQDGCEPEWFTIPHQDADGIGAFAQLLRTQGYGAFETLPRARPRERDAGTSRRLVRLPMQVAAWKEFDHGWRGGSPEAACPSALAWRSLSVGQTQRLLRNAASHGASFNSLALWALHQAVAPSLVADSGPSLWAMPVNLRGAVASASEAANQFAVVDIELPQASSVAPREVHARIKQLLAQGAHWQAWDAWNIGERVGLDGMRMLFEKSLRAGRMKTGLYSNLGEWDDRRTTPAVDWVFLAPVSKGVPFAACLLTWRGRLTAAIQAHPALATDPSRAAGWLNAWLDTLLEAGDACA